MRSPRTIFLPALLAGTAGLCSFGVANAAEGMTVTEFLRRIGDGRVGPAALINPRTRPAVLEIIGAVKALKRTEERAKAEGRPSSFCPPPDGSMAMPQLVALLRALPPAQQQQQVRDAIPTVLQGRFPCHASDGKAGRSRGDAEDESPLRG